MVGWHHRLNGHEFEQTPGREAWGVQSMGLQRVRHDLATEQPQLLRLCSRAQEPQLLSPHTASTEAHAH